MSTTTWNSLLLSNGSIFTRTALNATSEHASNNRTITDERNIQRFFVSVTSAVITLRYDRVLQPSVSPSACLPAWPRSRRNAAHGDTTNAMISENSIAADAPTGIGRMYGPISPRTNAIGRIAAITANVARIVGLPN